MSHGLEMSLTEEKWRCVGLLWSQDLQERVCIMELTGWCWVWIGKAVTTWATLDTLAKAKHPPMGGNLENEKLTHFSSPVSE